MSARRFSVKRLGLSLMAALLAASCYTGPVNMRPRITIIEPVQPFWRGQSPVYEASPIDPEDGLLTTVDWVATKDPCPLAADVQRPDHWPPEKDWVRRVAFAVPTDLTVSKFCVWAKATDRHGAWAIAAVHGYPENHPPSVTLTRFPASPASVPLNAVVPFTAELKDEDGSDQVRTVAWTAIPSGPRLLDSCPGQEPSDTQRCFVFETPGSYKITVSVTDDIAEASTSESIDVLPGNAPVARLELVTPAKADSYPLGTVFHLSGAKTSDGDPGDILDPTWNDKDFKAEAPTSTAELGDCDGMVAPFERCFRADAPGTYRVVLKVSDGKNVAASEELRLVVRPDTPPCLTATEPALNESLVPGRLDPNDPVKWFKVLRVEDDRDPYPQAGEDAHDRTTFRWFVNTGSGFKPAWDDFATFPLSTDGYFYGQEVSVRLEIFDRVTSASQLRTCTTDICKTSDTCVQRVTWKVQFVL